MNANKPLVGILGGMGPQAGLDLAEKLVAMTDTRTDQDHIPFVLFSMGDEIGDRTAYLLGDSDRNPAGAIADQLEMMSGLGVTLAVMACNTAYAGPIFDTAMERLRERGVELRVLHLVRETVRHIRERHPDVRRVGILGTRGTYQSNLYGAALEEAGLEAVLPDRAVRDGPVHEAIYSPEFGIKACPGAVTAEARDRVRSAIRHLRDRGAQGVILGCTELPLAVEANGVYDLPVFDPARVIAKRIILATCPDKLADRD